MADGSDQLRKFLRRFDGLPPDASESEVLEHTGLDAFAEPTSVVDQVERGSIVDSTSDSRVRIEHFPSTFQRPASYPDSWPFIPDADSIFGTIASEGGEVWMLTWPEPEATDELLRAVRHEMAGLGWHEHAVAAPSPDDPPAPEGPVQYIVWFHLGQRWRALTMHSAPVALVQLMEVDPDLLTPGWRARHGH
jgi:hypothetical protein